MRKQYVGQPPGGRDYQELATLTDTEGRRWRVYHRAKLHARTCWQGYKLASVEPVQKANYWLVHNPETGKVGQSKDAKLLAKRDPILFKQLVELFPDVGANHEVRP